MLGRIAENVLFSKVSVNFHCQRHDNDSIYELSL